MIEASCHCGAIRMEIASEPKTVTACACSICRRYGTLWAYYSPKDVRIMPPEGATETYMWGDRMLEFHRCKTCGCITHWVAVDRTLDRMGVNARLMPRDIFEAAAVRNSEGP